MPSVNTSVLVVVGVVACLLVGLSFKDVLRDPSSRRDRELLAQQRQILDALNAMRSPQNNGSSCNSHLSATVDCATGQTRRFEVPTCRTSFTVPQLLPDFMAHQVEWSLFAKNRAFYSVLTNFPPDDQVNESMTRAFYDSGRGDVQFTDEQIRQHWPGSKIEGDVLDFGCGLGRLGIALAQLPAVKRVVCVEQSVFHVQKTKHFTQHLPRVGRFMPMVSGPDLLMALQQHPELPKCFDYINSLIVFQHMILPLMVVYMEQLCDVLRPGGHMFLHVPSLTPTAPVCTAAEREASANTGGMQMHHMPEINIQQMFGRRGCDVDIVHAGQAHLTDDGNTAYQSLRLFVTKQPHSTNRCDG